MPKTPKKPSIEASVHNAMLAAGTRMKRQTDAIVILRRALSQIMAHSDCTGSIRAIAEEALIRTNQDNPTSVLAEGETK